MMLFGTKRYAAQLILKILGKDSNRLATLWHHREASQTCTDVLFLWRHRTVQMDYFCGATKKSFRVIYIYIYI